MNRTLAIGVVVAATVALSGCSLLRGSDRALPAPSTPATTPSSSATPTPTLGADPEGDLLESSAHPRTPTPEPTESAAPAPTLTPIPAGTVLAQGDVASPKGSVHFRFRVVAVGDDTFTAQYSGFTSTLPVPVGVGLFDLPRAVGDGLTYPGVGDRTLGGPTSTATAVDVPLSGSGVDPSHLTTLVTYSAAAPGQEVPVEIGAGKVLAVTTVRWSVPARQTNVHPKDAGARANATGPVTATTTGGAPRSYTVAPGDLIGDVAARFGISVRALVWLNAGVQVFGTDQHLYEGTTLNLDPLAR
ncbi:LysM peptidoglycan-binding domain-containing protein [Curtobacterium sp. VKM Ac-2884]|uniref:LysM peptidoglycan-binding domain-containing protein n=1 Tax=Curtobacterium sp. VKM Ac-2884 TaxID=2783818 RepID=UPI00188A2191|nr:LysM domain-containing protein [Curtobacterium sp. VKM Ac-2884]MBF4602985.1 LysM peptidoglycan-binding domain-containing protein [Curtobacterium sp. VKM Ac-2884]